ncbi:CYCD3-3 [Linum grandiflorum]
MAHQTPILLHDHDSDNLYCSEDIHHTTTCSSISNHSPFINNEHLFSWEEDELTTLLSKQEENPLCREPNLATARQEAADWILKVNTHFSFSTLTAVLALNYLDRFLLTFHLQTDKPWMTQLAAVACLSVAAKVEETYVPLLLQLQVGEESRYVFEPKTIQRMEILVLSALKWRMNPVTPFSFLDYMTRRIGLMRNPLCSEFLRRCQLIIVSLVSDCRSLCYLPSEVATAVMLHVINAMDLSAGTEYQSKLLALMEIDVEKVVDCRELIMELTSGSGQSKKRSRMLDSIPGSPNGVMDLSFCSDSSNGCTSASSSVSSSPEQPRRSKKGRVDIDESFIGMIPVRY